MLKNFTDYKRKAIKLLKEACKLREELACTPTVYSRSDDVLMALDDVIFYVGSSVCPPSCLCIVDFCEWAKEQ